MKRMNGRVWTRAASTGLCLAALFAAHAARAAWDFVPNLYLSARSEDNPYYYPDNVPALPQKAASSAALDMSVQMATYDQRSVLQFQPEVVVHRYMDSSNDNLNGEDWYFNGYGEYQWTTVKAGFFGDYRRQRLAVAEFGTLNFNLDAQYTDTGDTGRTAFINQYRDFYWVQPYLSFTLSPRNTLRIDIGNSAVSYSGGDLSFRTGFSDTRYSLTLQRNTDRQTQISAVMSVDSYNADINTNDFHTVTIEGQFSRPINPLWSFLMTAGVLRSDYQVVSLQSRVTAGATTDYIASVGFRRRTEKGGLNADVARDVYPSSNGYEVIRREARVYGDTDFSQRFGLDYGVWLQKTETLGGLNTIDNRNYLDLQLNFHWALKPVLYLVAGIEHQTQEFTNDILNRGTVTATTLDIGVRYKGLSKRNPPRPPRQALAIPASGCVADLRRCAALAAAAEQ
jgi:hypothetical protein